MNSFAYHRLLVPIVILILGVTFQLQLLPQLPKLQALIAYLPYVAFAIAILLSTQFNQSRLALIALLYGFIYGISHLGVSNQIVNPTAQLGLIAAVNLSVVVLSWLRDPGVFTHYSLQRLSAIALLLLITILCSQWYDIQINLFFSSSDIQLFSGLPLRLPQLLLWISLVGFLICFFRFYLHQSAANSAITISLLIYFAAENWLYQVDFHSTAYLVIAISFCIAVLLDSYHMAYRDELTGIPSRRALNQRALGLGKKYVVAMMDVDHFKKFNDTHGHDVGDQVLKMVAAKINQVTGGGLAYRYGGEEFTVIFSRKTIAEATEHLQLVRETIADYEMTIRGEERPENSKKQRKKSAQGNDAVSVTISIGVAERTTDLADFEQVIKAADLALYRAKESGRNCLSE